MINYSKKNEIIYGKMHNFIVIHNACHGNYSNRFTIYRVSKLESHAKIVGRELPFGFAIRYIKKMDKKENKIFNV